jgi:DNA-binding NarL/FixJ family response regulator
MVGHAEKIGELTRAWKRVVHGPGPAPTTVVITGSAGIGKTRLVSAALDLIAPQPALIAAGAARLHSPAPYDWLAAVLSRVELPDPSVPADALAWLRQDPDLPRERYAPEALLRIAVRVVRELVGAGPAVLVVEDLHALDPASLNLVADLATTRLPALLVVTSRPAGAPLVADTLARLAGAPGAVRQHLGPLDRSCVASVLAAAYPGTPLPEPVLDAVMARTGGVPFQLTELIACTPSPTALADPEPELTARERDVLSCLAAGMSNQQVATRLGISVRTVTVHVSNLLRKTRSRSRTDAALWAVRHRVDHSSVTTTSS